MSDSNKRILYWNHYLTLYRYGFSDNHEYEGCYDNKAYANTAVGERFPDNSIGRCRSQCISKGFKYFILEGRNGDWCYCVNDFLINSVKYPDHRCEAKTCSGASSQKCGDHLIGAVYKLTKVNDKASGEAKFCGTIAHFQMPTTDVLTTSYLAADVNICENSPNPPNNQALNICMKELTYCKKRGNL